MAKSDQPQTTLDEKIKAASDRGDQYTPSYDEWQQASRYQRKRMTWPWEVIRWIRGAA